jgi:DNA repair exonuclease SbcCD ATPase subunit
MSDTTPLPEDIDALKAMLAEARALLAERDLVIEQLRAQIDKLRRMQFGRKSEQLDRQIARLETELEDLSAARGVADMRRAHSRANASTATAEAAPKEALPSHLSRDDHVLEPQPECPDCGQPMQALGEDVSEQLARVAAAFKVIRTIRRKMAATCSWVSMMKLLYGRSGASAARFGTGDTGQRDRVSGPMMRARRGTRMTDDLQADCSSVLTCNGPKH